MNIETLMSVCGAGLLAAVAMVLLRELRREYTTAILLGMSVLVLLIVLPKVGEAVGLLHELADAVDNGYLGLVIRGVGITYLTGTACELCRSMGETGIAGTIETVGRMELLMMCLPLFRELISMALLT